MEEDGGEAHAASAQTKAPRVSRIAIGPYREPTVRLTGRA
jgi:hypothetical protein